MFDFPFSPIEQPTSLSLDLVPMEAALARRDIGAVIKDSTFFFTLFCKVFHSLQIKESNKFLLRKSENTLMLSGGYAEEIQKTIEVMRPFFLNGYEGNYDFKILSIKFSETCFLRNDFEGTLDLTNHRNPEVFQVYKWPLRLIRRNMTSFCLSLGARCIHLLEQKKVNWGESVGKMEERIKTFKIEWIAKRHEIYPIVPKAIPNFDLEKLQKKLYTDYQAQNKLCDLTLRTGNGEVRIHTFILSTYGGDVFKTLLEAPMKEAKEQAIVLEKFSLDTVKAFIDFLYLGEKTLDEEVVQQKGIDMSSLLELAQMYQIEPLINICTNLLSLFSSKEDAEKIQSMAEYYENDHLRELSKYLSKN